MSVCVRGSSTRPQRKAQHGRRRARRRCSRRPGGKADHSTQRQRLPAVIGGCDRAGELLTPWTDIYCRAGRVRAWCVCMLSTAHATGERLRHGMRERGAAAQWYIHTTWMEAMQIDRCYAAPGGPSMASPRACATVMPSLAPP